MLELELEVLIELLELVDIEESELSSSSV